MIRRDYKKSSSFKVATLFAILLAIAVLSLCISIYLFSSRLIEQGIFFKGRECARVAGTLCHGEVQGSCAKKLGSCMNCAFYSSEHYGSLHKHVRQRRSMEI